MNQHDFDKDLKNLYQKRKAQTITPDVVLPVIRKTNKRMSKPYFLILGSISAFGLMAFVKHYTQPAPPPASLTQTVKYSVEVSQYEEVEEDAIIVPTQLPLPLKPKLKLLQAPKIEAVLSTPIVLDIDVDLPKNTISHIKLTPIKPSAVIPLKPIVKVMPEYDVYDLNGLESASIELNYRVNNLGDTHTIEVIKSSVNRKLQKSAVNALSQWRYNAEQSMEYAEKQYRVVFDFTAESK